MKTLFAVAALALALPGSAPAQSAGQPQGRPVSDTRDAGVAAGTLPNSFDAPAATPARPDRAAPVQDPPSEPSSPEVVAAAETALKATVVAAQNGTLNYDDMTPDLAEQVREQAAAMTPLIQGFGRLQTVEHRGRENGAELFLVTFENRITQWIVGMGPDDKIAALLFRPAPEASDDQS